MSTKRTCTLIASMIGLGLTMGVTCTAPTSRNGGNSNPTGGNGGSGTSGGTPGGSFTPPVSHVDPVVVIQDPTAATHVQSGASMTIAWNFSGIASPVWKIFINDSNGVFMTQLADPQCGSSPCFANRTINLPAGNYELYVKDDSTAVGDKSAFVVE